MIDFSYEIVRSPKRKKLTITVERDQAVIVHSPQETADDEIQRVIESTPVRLTHTPPRGSVCL